MDILHDEQRNKGSFYLEQNHERLAELIYRNEPGRMVIEHTEVYESLQGKNVGFSLVERAVEYAREQQKKVVPLCTFANKVIKAHKEFQDVLELFFLAILIFTHIRYYLYEGVSIHF